MSETITIRLVPWEHPDAVRLVAAQQLEIQHIKPKAKPGMTASAANIPVFLVAYQGDIAVGCGGLRPEPTETGGWSAEIKRMYAAPGVRGSVGRKEGETNPGPSVAQIVLEALEHEARSREWLLMKAGTSRKGMEPARRFYEKFGYVLCGEAEGYSDSDLEVHYEKRLEGNR